MITWDFVNTYIAPILLLPIVVLLVGYLVTQILAHSYWGKEN